MRKIYIHVGFHKTATSSFQDTCMRNYDNLLLQGVLYPKIKSFNDLHNNHGVIFTSLFMDKPESFHVNILNNYSERVSELNESYLVQLKELFTKHDKDILISGEAISTLSESWLGEFRNYIEQFDFKVEVICCVRSPYSFLCSDLQEIIKNGNKSLMDNISVPLKTRDIEKLDRVFGDNIRYFSFKEACSHRDGPIGYLFDLINIDYTGFEFVDSNFGLNNITTRLLSYLNVTNPVFVHGSLNPLGRSSEILDFGGGKFLLTEKEIESCRALLDSENYYLKNRFDESYCDRNYTTSDELKFDESQPIELYELYYKPEYLSQNVLKFILEHSNIEVVMNLALKNNNASFCRDLGLYVWKKEKNICKAYALMTQAKNLRPTGPMIGNYLKQIEEQMQSVGVIK